MKVIFLLMGLLCSVSAFSFDYSRDCIKRYQHRIDQSSDWAVRNHRFPRSGEKRAEKAQAMINLINQSNAAITARYPGGQELVDVVYAVNRVSSFSHQRRNIREVARVVREVYRSGFMCPDYTNLWNMRDVRRHVRRVLK